jgi:uncharacterized protein YrzB (UPF0473 family)
MVQRSEIGEDETLKQRERALKVKKTIFEFIEAMNEGDVPVPITKWPDEAWEDVEETLGSFYFEEWKSLITGKGRKG